MPFCGPMDIAFIIDNTGSMNGAIGSIKTQLENVVDNIAAASGGDYRLALITPDTESVNVRLPFEAANGAAFQAAVSALPGGGFGGGTPESTDECLNTVVNALAASDRTGGQQTGDFTAFRTGVVKTIVLVTDAVPGGFNDVFTSGIDTPGSSEYRANSYAEGAAAAGIRISSVAVGAADANFLRIMENYASVTSGLFLQADADGDGTDAAVLESIDLCGGAPVTNLVPQAQSRVFSVDSTDLPTMTDTSLWELYRNGDLQDSGTRFDRLGANGWGVEPSLDFSHITVTVPRHAAIGEGYDARIRHTSGDFPTLHFIVTPAADPPVLENTLMAHYLFSTGQLTVSLPLPSPILSRQAVGAPSASTLPLANLLDADLQTLADLTQTDAGNYQYLIIDLGSAQKIGRVIAGNVALVGAGTVLAYVSTAKITNGVFGTATALVAGSGALGNDREYIPAAAAASVTGRYVYLVPSAGTGITFGDLDVRGEEWNIGTLQNTGIDFSFQHKEARGGAAYNLMPVADAQYDGACALSSESLEADARSMNLFTGALVAGTSPQTITAGAKTKPLPFVAEYRTVDTDGRAFRCILYVCYAPGFTWAFKRDDFSAPGFTAAVYLPDATARAWRIYLVR